MTEKSIPEVKEIELKSGLSSWTFEDYKKEILKEDSVCLIAKNKVKVTGFIIARLIMQQNGDAASNDKNKLLANEAEIYNIAVSEEARRKGTGQALFNAFLAVALERNISFVWLEVRESNFQAVNFYQKNNFKKIQVRKNFYRFPTEDGILMKLELDRFGRDKIL
jgi:ribosomal-protein-alanine N-acetyltransferase